MRIREISREYALSLIAAGSAIFVDFEAGDPMFGVILRDDGTASRYEATADDIFSSVEDARKRESARRAAEMAAAYSSMIASYGPPMTVPCRAKYRA